MFHPSLLFWVVLLLSVTQVQILLVTVYFHRAMSHRALELASPARRVCRFLGWFLLGMNPVEFAAVHRKHHARCDVAGDPHSPVQYGAMGVLLKGIILYRREASNPDTIAQYGQGLPCAFEDAFYCRHANLGLAVQAIVWVSLFGLPGLLAFVLVAAWIPFWAAGVVNGLGHAIGYRRYHTPDRSTNLVPFGCWLGGEELHNNHHADPSSAFFAHAWYEIDFGGWLVHILTFLGLASLRRTSPPTRPLAALLRDRYVWLRKFRTASAFAHATANGRAPIAVLRICIPGLVLGAWNHRLRQLVTGDVIMEQLRSMDVRLCELLHVRHPAPVLAAAFDGFCADLRALNAPALNRWLTRLHGSAIAATA